MALSSVSSPPINIPAPTPPSVRARRQAFVAVSGDAASLERPLIDETLIDVLLWDGWRFERDAPWNELVMLRPPPTHPRAGEVITPGITAAATWRTRDVRVPSWATD